MPTLEQTRAWAEEFERQYPETLPRRLQWLTQNVGIRQYHLLRLMGVSRLDAEECEEGSVGWSSAVETFSEAQMSWAEERIYQALDFYHFDWKALEERLHQPLDREFSVARPGGETLSLGEIPEEEREDILLNLIAQGGAQSITALIAFLSMPGVVPAHA